MNFEKLGAYRINPVYTEGVDIFLDRAPGVPFTVALPGKHNRAYIAALYSGIEFSIEGDDAQLNTSAIDLRERQEKAFLDHCLKKMDGEAFNAESLKVFSDGHPDALEELMVKANELALEIQEDAEQAGKTSAVSSSGSSDGTATLSSIAS